MADKSTRMVLAALSRAAASPEGAPLFAVRGGPGLFPAAPAGRQAAQRCKDEGWLRFPDADGDASALASSGAIDLLRKKPKTTTEICYLTEKGLAWLLGQTSARGVGRFPSRLGSRGKRKPLTCRPAFGVCKMVSTRSKPAPRRCWNGFRAPIPAPPRPKVSWRAFAASTNSRATPRRFSCRACDTGKRLARRKTVPCRNYSAAHKPMRLV